MSYDLQFRVDNGDGTTTRPELAMHGEMDHLPDHYSHSHTTTASSGAGGGQEGVTTASSIQYIQDKLNQSSHPTVIVFHVLFKLGALFLYIFGGWLVGGSTSADSGASFITVTVACVLLLAADFWTVKNVTGRLLVGLRWWNKVEDDTTTWIFESAHNRPINNFDQSFFWMVLYITPVVWGALFLLGILKFQFTWLMIVVMALALSIANVYGYYKCSTDQKAKFERMTQNYAQQGAFAIVRAGMMSLVAGAPPPPNAGGGGRNYV